ncbi:hypothetical protein [Demetria terragena]|uniref:hypothetical protein n=1 Tax=Demetria terragena TaxID=63959 RepID=UPI00037CAE7A|nr:hypothetical protein [Demetria terragena]
MRTSSALVAATAATLAFAGCSSNGGEPSVTSAGASATSPAASAAPDSAVSDAPSSETAESPSAATETSAPTSDPATASPSAKDEAAPGGTVTQAQLTTMATKLGCPSTPFQSAKPTSTAGKVGSPGGIQCRSGKTGYLLALHDAKRGPEPLVRSLKSTTRAPRLPYLHGENWVVLAITDTSAKTPTFSEDVLKDAQRKIGSGTISTA